ncbi:hypothetical protein P8452_12009 [Trifolium repens]|nr:hypothetical protein P8452_12009 [Trifolium repens]
MSHFRLPDYFLIIDYCLEPLQALGVIGEVLYCPAASDFMFIPIFHETNFFSQSPSTLPPPLSSFRHRSHERFRHRTLFWHRTLFLNHIYLI